MKRQRQRLLWAVLADAVALGVWAPEVWSYLVRDRARRTARHLRQFPKHYRNVRVVRFKATPGQGARAYTKGSGG